MLWKLIFESPVRFNPLSLTQPKYHQQPKWGDGRVLRFLHIRKGYMCLDYATRCLPNGNGFFLNYLSFKQLILMQVWVKNLNRIRAEGGCRL